MRIRMNNFSSSFRYFQMKKKSDCFGNFFQKISAKKIPTFFGFFQKNPEENTHISGIPHKKGKERKRTRPKKKFVINAKELLIQTLVTFVSLSRYRGDSSEFHPCKLGFFVKTSIVE